MKIEVRMAIMSHLSDVQELLPYRGSYDEIMKRVNFTKLLLLTYPDTSVEVENKTLNEIWRKVETDFKKGNEDEKEG